MKRVCCECKKVLDKGTGEEFEETSHGLCAECYREYMKKYGLWDESALALYLKTKGEEIRAESHWTR